MADMLHVAVLVAGGQGTRMRGDNTSFACGKGTRTRGGDADTGKKQYLDLAGKPLMYHALYALEQAAFIDAIVVVVSEGDEAFVKKEVIERFGFRKVCAVTAGGAERYHSVRAGLLQAGLWLKENGGNERNAYVYIQDAARPFLTEEILQNVREGVVRHGACVAAVPVKDTIKQADEDGFVTGTPERKTLRAMQTPQAFSHALAADAYGYLAAEEESGADLSFITDDAMVVERYFPEQRIFLAEGSYRNIKVTTPEDLAYAAALANMHAV